MTVTLQVELAEDLVVLVGRMVGLALLAGALAAGLGAVHRWYAAERVPRGLAVLGGLSGVAIEVNTTTALGAVIGGNVAALDPEAALVNGAIFAAAGVTASAGGRVGDRLAATVAAVSGARSVETDVSRLVRSVGRVTPVELPDDPDDIGDIEGYDPVAPDVKESLAGRTLVFPRRLTVEELRERLVARLRTDHGVGHVDVDIGESGEVEYLAVGSRESGLGPTLPPETVAVAVTADPAFSASPGDVVQVWGGDPPARVATAEVRGTAGDVVTLAVDAADAADLDAETRYRLATLPVEPRTDREFASLLRAADETMGVTTVDEGSDLVGAPVGAVDVAVVAVRGPDGAVEAIPSRSRTLAAGETVYAVARPDRLRRLEAAATGAAAHPT